MFAHSQVGRDIARITTEVPGIHSGVEGVEGRKGIRSPRQHGVGFGNEAPVNALGWLGRGSEVCGVQVAPGGPGFASVENEISGIVFGIGGPSEGCGSQQVRGTTHTRNPPVSEKIAAATKIDRSSGIHGNILRRDGNAPLRQSCHGHIHTPRIDPGKAVGTDAVGNKNSFSAHGVDPRDGNHRALREGQAGGFHEGCLCASNPVFGFRCGCSIPAKNDRSHGSAQVACNVDGVGEHPHPAPGGQGKRRGGCGNNRDRALGGAVVVGKDIEVRTGGRVDLGGGKVDRSSHIQDSVATDISTWRREGSGRKAKRHQCSQIDQACIDRKGARASCGSQIVERCSTGSRIEFPEGLERVGRVEGGSEFLANCHIGGGDGNGENRTNHTASSKADCASGGDRNGFEKFQVAAVGDRRGIREIFVTQIQEVESAGGKAIHGKKANSGGSRRRVEHGGG